MSGVREAVSPLKAFTKQIYGVPYPWNTTNIPADSGAYQSVQDAEAAMDQTYTASSTSTLYTTASG